MAKVLLGKSLLIALVFLVLQVPLVMIQGLVGERWQRQHEVVEDLARSSYGRQALAGPLLLLPYVEEYDEGLLEGRKVEHRRIERAVYVFPARESVEGAASVETKSRGLFKARVFEWRGTVRGEFNLDAPPSFARSRSDSRITWGRPVVGIYLGDPRGLAATPTLEWNGAPIALERGSGLPNAASGLHAALPEPFDGKPARLGYTLSLALHGTESIALVPLAQDATIRVATDWPHASFAGQFLPRPDARRSAAPGFDATWTISGLASNAQQQVASWLDGKARCTDISCVDHAEVRFIEPVDIYALSDRAIKYGFLFVGLTLACFFVYDVLKALRVHPAQYLLVGLALATFFLLLLGLSEHIPFGIAYLIASTACIGLLTYYLGHVLGALRRGLSFGLLLAALYAALYGLLVSEDNALLLGSLLVFALIAAAMVLTRRVDWYAVGARPRDAGA